MCDKALPQQHLAEQLSSLLIQISQNPKLKNRTARLKACIVYLDSFWSTMVTEWHQVDRHRTDKYYSLMRKMLFYTFVVLRQSGWKESAVQEANELLTKQGAPLL